MSDFYIEELPRSTTVKLNSSSTGTITLIPLPTDPTATDLGLDETLYNVKLIDREIKSIQGLISIKSLPAAPIPEIDDLDSDLKQSMTIRDWMWTSGRKELRFYKLKNSINYFKAAVSCQNIEPYLIQDLLAYLGSLKVGLNEQLTCQMSDAGYGLLTGSDEIIIDIQWIDLVAISKTDRWLISTITGGGSSDGGTIDLSQILNFTKLADALPIDIPDWCNPGIWEITSNVWSNTNPSAKKAFLNDCYREFIHIPSGYLNAYYQVDFKAPFLIKKLGFNMTSGSAYNSDSLDVTISVDGTNWIDIAVGVPQADEISLASNTTYARYMRFYNRDSSIPSGWLVWDCRIFGNY